MHKIFVSIYGKDTDPEDPHADLSQRPTVSCNYGPQSVFFAVVKACNSDSICIHNEVQMTCMQPYKWC